MNETRVRSLLREIRKRNICSLARAISIFENDARLRPQLLKGLKLLRSPKVRTFLIGVTGSAGSGKSTLIREIAKVMRRGKKKVAIIAVDPTSPRTKGAFLGDRVRMQELAEDPGVFIRSMASRGAHGGIARATRDAAILFSKAGYDFVLIETIGAGQLDYRVTEIADLTLLVLTPEAGDEMQFMKAGLGELADAFVVNKSDRPGAQKIAEFLKPPVFKTVAERNEGIEPLYQFILAKASSLRAKRSNL